jgi:hypothetical protein
VAAYTKMINKMLKTKHREKSCNTYIVRCSQTFLLNCTMFKRCNSSHLHIIIIIIIIINNNNNININIKRENTGVVSVQVLHMLLNYAMTEFM